MVRWRPHKLKPACMQGRPKWTRAGLPPSAGLRPCPPAAVLRCPESKTTIACRQDVASSLALRLSQAEAAGKQKLQVDRDFTFPGVTLSRQSVGQLTGSVLPVQVWDLGALSQERFLGHLVWTWRVWRRGASAWDFRSSLHGIVDPELWGWRRSGFLRKCAPSARGVVPTHKQNQWKSRLLD